MPIFCSRFGNYQEALKYHQKLLEIALQSGDKRGEASEYTKIGSAHHRLGNYHEALKYQQKLLEIVLELGNKRGEGIAYGHIGNAHKNLDNFQEIDDRHQSVRML